MPTSGREPAKIKPRSLSDYFEVMTRAVFQTRMPAQAVESRWDGFRTAFAAFDPERVARYGQQDVERLLNDPGIIRNRAKIEATIANARTLVHLDEEHGSFKQFLRSFDGFDATAAALHRNFKYLGEFAAYYFLWVVDEPVPPHDEWMASRATKTRSPRSG
jgi:3-methyladenine DNA glycosylase Tag